MNKKKTLVTLSLLLILIITGVLAYKNGYIQSIFRVSRGAGIVVNKQDDSTETKSNSTTADTNEADIVIVQVGEEGTYESTMKYADGSIDGMRIRLKNTGSSYISKKQMEGVECDYYPLGVEVDNNKTIISAHDYLIVTLAVTNIGESEWTQDNSIPVGNFTLYKKNENGEYKYVSELVGNDNTEMLKATNGIVLIDKGDTKEIKLCYIVSEEIINKDELYIRFSINSKDTTQSYLKVDTNTFTE